MVQSGAVRLNDPIQKYLPAGIVAPTYNGIPITLASLAEHRAGLPTDPPNASTKLPANPYAGYTLAMLYSALQHYSLTRAPGTRYEYSNFGFALLGQLLVGRAHKCYATLVDRRILQPLAMKDTVVIGSQVSKRRLVPAYTYDGRPQVPWDLGALSPAGSIESDLRDMLVYVRANMTAPAGPLGRSLFFAQQARAPEDNEDSVGLAWETSLQHGFVHKAGGTGGYSALLVFDRRRHYAMVLLVNLPNSAQFGQLAEHILMPATVSAPIEWALVKKAPSPYNGTYPIANVPGFAHFAIFIFKYNGRLYLEIPQAPPEQLVNLKGGRYSWASQHAIITFNRDANGKVTAITVLQNGQLTRVKKQP